MEQTSWFDRKRADMLADIQHKTLHSQIFVNFDIEDLLKIDEILESFNTEQTRKSGSDRNIGLDIDDELASAVIGEVVQEFDRLTIENIESKSSKQEISFKQDNNSSTVDNANNLAYKFFSFFVEELPSNGCLENCFIITSPEIITLLQINKKIRLIPKVDGFRGPNNTILWGYLNKIPTYSYLFADKKIIMGYYNKETDESFEQVMLVKDISFT